MRNNYVVVSTKDWDKQAFDLYTPLFPGKWHYTGWSTADSPRYIFFLHWSEYIPPDIYENYECVGFHLADLPDGRGGSPLQNQIARGTKETMLTAFRIGKELDAGPIYGKRAIPLRGSAQEIFEDVADKAFELIGDIVLDEPTPIPQEGEPTVFKRRTPEESEIPQDCSLPELYDHIRMLDAETYPHAFLEWCGWRFEFTSAVLEHDHVRSSVTIRRIMS